MGVYSIQNCWSCSHLFLEEKTGIVFKLTLFFSAFASPLSTCVTVYGKWSFRFWCYHIYCLNDSTESFKENVVLEKGNLFFAFLILAMIWLQNYSKFVYAYKSTGDIFKRQTLIQRLIWVQVASPWATVWIAWNYTTIHMALRVTAT